jgi:hypothetical protein
MFVLPFELRWSMKNVFPSIWVELMDEIVLFSLEFVRIWSMNNDVLPSLEFVRSREMDEVLPSFAFVRRWIFFSWIWVGDEWWTMFFGKGMNQVLRQQCSSMLGTGNAHELAGKLAR